jgi:hypothetical protein
MKENLDYDDEDMRVLWLISGTLIGPGAAQSAATHRLPYQSASHLIIDPDLIGQRSSPCVPFQTLQNPCREIWGTV